MKRFKDKNCIAAIVLLLCFQSVASDVPSDPDNAALLYYQAFLSFPGQYNEISMPLEPSPSGAIEPSQTLRDYLKTCHDTFEFAKAAAQLPRCDWGLRYSLGNAVPICLAPIRQLAFNAKAQALVFAADRDYRQALEYCLLIHSMAEHLVDENMGSFLVGIALHGLANKGIRQILSIMPADTKLLQWLGEELARWPRGENLANALKNEEAIELRTFRLDKDQLIELAKTRASGVLSPKREERLNNADAAFLKASRNYFARSMATCRVLLEEPGPYETKFPRLQEYDERMRSEEETNPHATLTAIFGTKMARIYTLTILVQTGHNALRTAIRIYEVKAETGALPEELPSGLPGDLFSDKDFVYVKTEEGFLLRCHTAVLGRDKPREYAFRVK
ncbi:MAG: hypothetical protein IH892_10970 [Planctomycetes bacterium]|nr:hypothetical protein [Planctomycetota bacterium]